MTFRRWVFVLAAVTALGASTVPPASGDGGIEAQVMAKIRGYRSGGLIHHSGLYGVARAHSMRMSREGRMSHDNADQRITYAQPDPFETNGAPDDGVPPAAWCENVTYSTGHPASEVPGRLFSQWAGSGAHARCMRDTSRNVGAVGVYYDGSTWWATFIATTDNTPPGGAASPVKTSAPKPKPAQAPVAAPATGSGSEPAADPVAPESASDGAATAAQVTPSPQAASGDDPEDEAAQPQATAPTIDVSVSTEGERIVAEGGPLASTESSSSVAYGWQELAAVAAILVLASVVAGRRTRPRSTVPSPVFEPPPVTWEPPPDPERELVGSGARAD